MMEPVPVSERWIDLAAEYEARWPRRRDDWVISGTVGITVGDLRELAQYFSYFAGPASSADPHSVNPLKRD